MNQEFDTKIEKLLFANGIKTKKVKTCKKSLLFLYCFSRMLRFVTWFVSYCKFCSTFGTTASQYAASVCCCHSFTKSVFVFSFSLRRLECPFHWFLYLALLFSLFISDCKNRCFFRNCKLLITFLFKFLAQIKFFAF